MARLTEDMVIARTKSSDLGAVKKLNCWGSDLADISLVRRLTNVEVLSLSLNKITSLAEFQHCRNLVELYVRRNEIRDLSELCYLQELPRLRKLLLSENPCVDSAGPQYRATVLRCLPNLELLDNTQVTPDEIENAMRCGLILEHPLNRRVIVPLSNGNGGNERISPEPMYYGNESPPPQSGRRQSSQYDYEEDASSYRNANNSSTNSPPVDYYYQNGEREERKSPDLTVPTSNNVSPVTTNGNHRPVNMPSMPVGSLTDDRSGSPTNNNGEVNTQRRVSHSPEYYQRNERELNGSSRRASADYASDGSRNYPDSCYDDLSPPHQTQRSSVANIPMVIPASRMSNSSQARNKPRTKSNLLSAVLCLIPELDWASLEVVELAVRRRMDELLSD